MIDRRRIPAFFALALAASLAVPTLGAAPALAAESVLVIEGKGWGHGVGMAQDGALAMGRAGADTQTILQQFYPGTTTAWREGIVRVSVFNSGARTESVVFPDGGELRASESGSQPAGFPVVVSPGGSAEVSFDGMQYRVRLSAAPVAAGVKGGVDLPLRLISSTATTAPSNATTSTGPATSTTAIPTAPNTAPAPAPSPPATRRPPPVPAGSPAPPPRAPAPSPPAGGGATAGTIWVVPAPGGTTLLPGRGRRYRGEMEVTASGPGGNLRFVNRVDVEDYLRGMGEVRDPSWPAASLQTQAVAARTYALRSVDSGGEICDDDRCQVYIGQTVEYPEMDRAVADTRSQVLTYNGALAMTVYSANAGGTTATPQEAWGPSAAGEPYLRSAPYPTGDPMPWIVEIGFGDLAGRLGYPGTVTGARVSSAGPSGRALEVTLSGDAGDQAVDGLTFASKLSMRSNLFAFRSTQVVAAPPPPPQGAGLIQELPGSTRPLFEAPLTSSMASVAVSLPEADRMGMTGLLAFVVLLGAFKIYAHRRSRRAGYGGNPSRA
ncbi:MAG: SpoIID/LytB domain-containing protein [Actinomycetota bacterium]|nr:SpoIID/LytB domain-containing protein [Actinomycetota bacterium]